MRLVLVRPHHPRIRRRHLGRAGEAALRHRGAPTRRSQPTASAFQPEGKILQLLSLLPPPGRGCASRKLSAHCRLDHDDPRDRLRPNFACFDRVSSRSWRWRRRRRSSRIRRARRTTLVVQGVPVEANEESRQMRHQENSRREPSPARRPRFGAGHHLPERERLSVIRSRSRRTRRRSIRAAGPSCATCSTPRTARGLVSLLDAGAARFPERLSLPGGARAMA